MKEKIYIPIIELCQQYSVKPSFFEELHDHELIPREFIGEARSLHPDGLIILEKIIRIHHELQINVEGIDVVFNLLDKIEMLQSEMDGLKRKLAIYEEILSV